MKLGKPVGINLMSDFMEIRPATIDDAEGVAYVGIKTWQTAYKGIFPKEKLKKMDVAERTERWRNNIVGIKKDENATIFVAEDKDGNVVGFATGGKYPDTDPYDCSIGAIYVLDEYQKKGIGSKLVKEMLEFFKSRQHKTMIIWVLEENPYRKFYDKLGGIAKERTIYEKWEIKKELIGYVWDDIKKIQLDI